MTVPRTIAKLPDSVRRTLHSRGRTVAFAAVALLTLALFILIPVRLIPGNDLRFQLQIMKWQEFALLAALSLLNALLVMMQVHIYGRERELWKGVRAAGASGAGGVSAVFASMLTTASCSACVAGIFGFLGTGSVLFMLNNRRLFVAAAIGIVSAAIILASRRIQNDCARCAVGPARG